MLAMPSTPDPSPSPPVRLLVVEDDADLLNLYNCALPRTGQEVTVAANGREGLDLYQQALLAGSPFDLVILDFTMPDMDGQACARGLRSLHPQARVLLVSGTPQLPSGLGELVSDMLAKPFRLTELFRRVDNLLADRA
ncbi:MAG: response regulator [Deltaproteobacteria bacterium]|nr:response regulator [Deltaproteobacteria bacterium]